MLSKKNKWHLVEKSGLVAESSENILMLKQCKSASHLQYFSKVL